jgi:XisH protein
MPQRDRIHNVVKRALIKDRWNITDDPYIIEYGSRFLYVDLGITDSVAIDANTGNFIGVERGNSKVIVEIKDFQSRSAIADLEQAIGQYVLYRLLLNKTAPEREIYLAVSTETYNNIFSEPIGQVVISDLPLKLLSVDLEKEEIKQWIPSRPIEIS